MIAESLHSPPKAFIPADRQDIFHLENVLKNTQGIFIGVHKEAVRKEGKFYYLTTDSLNQQIKDSANNSMNWELSTEVFFREQPSVEHSFTAFSVGKQKLVTTYQSLYNEEKEKVDLSDCLFIKGFRYEKVRDSVGVFSEEDVYKPKKNTFLTSQEWDFNLDKGLDWAVIELEREIIEPHCLDLNDQNDLKEGTPLYMLGHPKGLPMKYASCSQVINHREGSNEFYADLGGFAGNAGSPIFNALTHKVEGFLIENRTDIFPDESSLSMIVDGCDISLENEKCQIIQPIVELISSK